MDLLFAILPFFNAGLVGSIAARITGINMSIYASPGNRTKKI